MKIPGFSQQHVLNFFAFFDEHGLSGSQTHTHTHQSANPPNLTQNYITSDPKLNFQVSFTYLKVRQY